MREPARQAVLELTPSANLFLAAGCGGGDVEETREPTVRPVANLNLAFGVVGKTESEPWS